MTRDELLAIIDQAAREGSTELDLAWKGISELPAEIGQLASLQSLKLSGNQFTLLPKAIGQLVNLHSLNLVWEPRRGVGQCQVEDWLKLIRLRVGDDARVLIVSTHSKTGERIARIDKPVFLRDFGSMIVGFYEVDSLVDDPETGEKVGVAKLKQAIIDAAADLEQMGMGFNRNWKEARNELLDRPEPRISYEDFAAVCTDHGLAPIDAETLAHLMHDLGYIVHYADDERLRDDVVLQPEWLTKAIGFVLEDRTTQEMDGILPDRRLHEVWRDHPFRGETRYDAALYPFFLRLMEKYDVSYRLLDGTASLVAQHVPQVRSRTRSSEQSSDHQQNATSTRRADPRPRIWRLHRSRS